MPMAMVMGPFITMGMASMSVSMLLGMVMWPIITKKHEKKESQRCEAERQKLYKEYLF